MSFFPLSFVNPNLVTSSDKFKNRNGNIKFFDGRKYMSINDVEIITFSIIK